MEPGTLEKKIAKLPESLKVEVEQFVDTLLSSEKQNMTAAEPQVIYGKSKAKARFGGAEGLFNEISDDFAKELISEPKKKREFGSLKGFVTYMAEDFDAPLEEFKDYM